MKDSRALIVFGLVMAFLAGIRCASSAPDEQSVVAFRDKITFDVPGRAGAEYAGSSAGNGVLDYEFCIPAEKAYVDEVQAIDLSVKVYPGSRGRIGCASAEYLCIGNTHQENYRDILRRLSGLDYVKQIDQCFWE